MKSSKPFIRFCRELVALHMAIREKDVLAERVIKETMDAFWEKMNDAEQHEAQCFSVFLNEFERYKGGYKIQRAK